MEDIALIDNLNDHCLKHIFSILPIKERIKIGEVCKRWRIIDEEGWNDVKKLKVERWMSKEIVLFIFKRCGRFLSKLIIWGTKYYSYCLSMILKFCHLDKLIQIELVNCDFRDSNAELNVRNLKQILVNSKKLVHVTFGRNKADDEHDFLNFLNPETLEKLNILSSNNFQINPFQFPNLKDLTLRYAEIIEDQTINAEVSLESLEEMVLFQCVLPDNFIQRISTFNNLQDLSLCSMDIISNEHIRHIARCNHKIREITLYDSFSLTSDCFQYLGKMPLLEILRLDFINGNSQDIAHLTNVKTLIFEDFDETFASDGLIELIKNSSNLEKLVFSSSIVSRSLLDNVRKIFQRSQRKKHLSFIVNWSGCICDEFDDYVGGGMDFRADEDCNKDNGCLEKINYHPLLDLRVNTLFVDDDDYYHEINRLFDEVGIFVF